MRHHLVVDGNGSTFQATTTGALDASGKSSRRHRVVVQSLDVTLQGLSIVGSDTVSDLSRHPDFGAYDTHYAEENGSSVVQSDGVTLSNDTVRAVWGNGVELDASTAVVVRGVTIDKNGNNAIKVRDSRGVLFDQIGALHSRRAGLKLEPEARRTIDGVEIRSSTICSHGPAFYSSGVLGRASNVSIHDNRVDCAGIVAEVTRAGNPGDRRNWSITGNTVVSTRGCPPSPWRQLRRGKTGTPRGPGEAREASGSRPEERRGPLPADVIVRSCTSLPGRAHRPVGTGMRPAPKIPRRSPCIPFLKPALMTPRGMPEPSGSRGASQPNPRVAKQPKGAFTPLLRR